MGSLLNYLEVVLICVDLYLARLVLQSPRRLRAIIKVGGDDAHDGRPGILGSIRSCKLISARHLDRGRAFWRRGGSAAAFVHTFSYRLATARRYAALLHVISDYEDESGDCNRPTRAATMTVAEASPGLAGEPLRSALPVVVLYIHMCVVKMHSHVGQ